MESPLQAGDNQEFESPLDAVPVIKYVREIKKFVKTRRAILDREPLYLETQAQLKEKGLMGPWTFNVVQSTLDSIPGLLISFLCWAFYDVDSSAIPGDPIVAKILSCLKPLNAPFALLILVFGIAFACLPAGYVSGRSWKSAARKYLYFDGSFGLWPQLSLATSIALVSIPRTAARHSAVAGILPLIGSIGFLVSFFWQAILTVWKIRAELFEFDYLNRNNTMFAEMIEPPTIKYFVLVSFVLPIVVIALILFSYLLATLAAGAVHAVRG